MGAHNDTANDYKLFQDGTQNPVPPATGGTFSLGGKDRCFFTVGAGSYKLPDSIPKGVKVSVYATGAVTITTQAAVTMATLVDGQIAVFTARTATTWSVSILNTSSAFQTGFIPLPLTGWREVTSNDITNAAGNGGVLATDSTPTLEYVNGDTDSQIRMLWAAANVDSIACQVTLPTDLDRTANITIYIRGTSNGDGDLPGIDCDAFFDEGDTKVEDATATGFSLGGGVVDNAIVIAAADIPDTARTMSVELTPQTHGTDTLTVYATWIEYTKKYS
jgi:hypothetical protein